jgi:hypothetical protein
MKAGLTGSVRVMVHSGSRRIRREGAPVMTKV